MDAILRGVAVYAFLLLLFGALGRRTLAETTNFDLVLFIIIGQSTQLALLGDDFSVTNAVLLVLTLVAMRLGLAVVKGRASRAARWLGGGPPVVVVRDGTLLADNARVFDVGADDVLVAARAAQGIERLEQIRYAIVERTGEITIVPRSAGPA